MMSLAHVKTGSSPILFFGGSGGQGTVVDIGCLCTSYYLM